MAAFKSRDRDAFMAHWAKIMANPACAVRVIVADGIVAGQIGAWTDGAERLVGYWIGREFWGRGVAKHNRASIRVLQKAGFTLAREEAFDLPDGTKFEELVFRHLGENLKAET